ncbi:hypothetical protein ACS3QZ_10065 [Shimia sp. W99]
MTNEVSKFSRRGIVLGALAWPFAGLAHSGHGVGFVVADVTLRRVRGQTASLVVTLFNRGESVVKLVGAQVDGAAGAMQAVELRSGALVEVDLAMTFDGAVPAVFTVVLDFADHGEIPVAVFR